MPYPLKLLKPLSLTVDEEGDLSGSASFLASHDDYMANLYPTLKTGALFGNIMSGLSAPQMVITEIAGEPMETWDGNVLLEEITVQCSNKVKYIDDDEKYNFSVSIQTDIMTENYRANSVWQALGVALPSYDHELRIPYMIVTLSGEYHLMGLTSAGTVVSVSSITAQLNTVNGLAWDLSGYSENLGSVPARCAKFVGFSYDESSTNTDEYPSCTATFTFHIRAYDWNYKVRPAEVTKNAVDGSELYWQDKYNWLPTYTGNAVQGVTAVAGTPIWSGTNAVLGGDARLSQSVLDRELFPYPNGLYGLEYPEAVWCFL